jgi:hypothetical protein
MSSPRPRSYGFACITTPRRSLFAYVSETTVYVNGRLVEIPYDEKFWLDVICFSHAAPELLTQGYRSGARIHVLTWGSAAAGACDRDSCEADLYLREHRDAIVCVAAGKLQAEGRGWGPTRFRRTSSTGARPQQSGRHPAFRVGYLPGRHCTGGGRRAGCARRPRPSAGTGVGGSGAGDSRRAALRKERRYPREERT